MVDVLSFRKRLAEIEELLSHPTANLDLAALGKEHARLVRLIEKSDRVDALHASLPHLERSIAEEHGELGTLAKEELTAAREQIARLEAELDEELRPQDPNDHRDAIVEIRAGTGGDEATLFGQDLFRMYQRYAERKGWTTTLLSSSRSELKGVKEVIFTVRGERAYGLLKHEAGVHRVQRIPATEKSGRIHTSTATVAVLPKLEPVDLVIDPKELRIDTSTSRGHGGQSVNTTYSAIRILHLPTGLMVSCQDERSQIQNRERAMEILRARLGALRETERREQEEGARRSQIGGAKRSEKIRTYNVPQDRLTDHRLKDSFHGLTEILDGRIDPIIEQLRAALRHDDSPGA